MGKAKDAGQRLFLVFLVKLRLSHLSYIIGSKKSTAISYPYTPAMKPG